MEETRRKVPVENYDELFCLTVEDESKLIHRDIKELLNIFCRQYSNDKELGEFIRRHYGSSKRK